MLAAGAGEQIRPGMVAVVQTFGERVNFHAHVHAIASRGGWRKDGTWVPVAHADPGATEKVFRHHVLSFLRKRGLRRHLIHAYGSYANAARAKRKRDASNAVPAGASESSGPAILASRDASDQAECRDARRRWADLIRRIWRK